MSEPVKNKNKEILDRQSKKNEDEFPDRARPDGLVWEKHRREKNDAQLKHELKVFDGWVKGQLGFGS